MSFCCHQMRPGGVPLNQQADALKRTTLTKRFLWPVSVFKSHLKCLAEHFGSCRRERESCIHVYNLPGSTENVQARSCTRLEADLWGLIGESKAFVRELSLPGKTAKQLLSMKQQHSFIYTNAKGFVSVRGQGTPQPSVNDQLSVTVIIST